MTLNEYLTQNRVSFAAFGREIGATRVAVRRYATRDRIPTAEIMAKIYQATGGRVRPDSFYDLPAVDEAAQ